RAIAAKELRPSDLTGTKSEPKPFAFKLDHFKLESGDVEFVEELEDTDAEDRHVKLEQLSGEGSASFATLPEMLNAVMSLGGKLTLPVSGPVVVNVTANGADAKRDATVKLQVAGVELAAKAAMEGTEKLNVQIESLKAEPETVRAFVPAYPLVQTVNAAGTATQNGNSIQLDLSANASRAKVNLSGGFDLARFRTKDVKLDVDDVDLSELMKDGPKSELSLRLRANGGGTSLQNLDATASLDVPESSLLGQKLGPVEVEANAKNGRIFVPKLNARVPGAVLSGSAEGTPENLSAKGTLTATDLGLVARTLGAITGSPPMKLSGNGSLNFNVNGSPRAPALSANGKFDSLAYEDYRVSKLTLDAKLPNAMKPLEADASLKAAQVHVGERTFNDLSANVQTRGRDVSADVTTKGLTSIVLRAGGTLDDDNAGILLNALGFEYPEAEWTLEHPSHLRWPEGNVTVEPLALTTGPQRIELRAKKQQSQLDAQVKVQKLDLSRLPSAFVDKSLQLAGTIDATVSATGRLPKASVKADVQLNGAQFRDVKNVALALNGGYEQDRVSGTVQLSADPGAANGQFDVPITALLKRRHEPLSVTLDVPKFELQKALTALGRTEQAAGDVALNLSVKGYADDPELVLTVRGEGVRYEAYPPADQPAAKFFLEVKPAGERGQLAATLDAEAYRSHALASLQTPFTVAMLRAHPPTTEELKSADVRVELNADRVDLSAFGKDLKGTAALALKMTGSANEPLGTLDVSVASAQRGDMTPVNGTAKLSLEKERVHLGSTVSNAGATLLSLDAAVNAPPSALLDQKALERTPLSVELQLSPTSVATLEALSGNSESDLKGTVDAHFSAKGTLDAPELRLDGQVLKFGVADQALGQIKLAYSYRSTAHELALNLGSPSGGYAAIKAKTTLEVSLPALNRGVDVNAAPLDATLKADKFDLAFLSGISPKLRAISGTLDAEGHAGGTVGLPTGTGAAEWKNGRVALMGFGDYHDVHLKILATNDRIYLDDFSAQSGGGKMHLTADAHRAAAGFNLTASSEMEKFPLIFDDQLFAIATLHTTAVGEANATLVNISNLEIPDLHLELPQIKRKDLQDLDRPDDIVLVKNGEFLDKKQAKRRAEAKALEDAKKNGTEPTAVAVATNGDEGSGREYRILINAPRNLWVRGADVNVELGLSESFRVEYREVLQLFGSVGILQGRATVMGRRFDLQKDSSVRFQGPAKTPYINATAVYVNEREQVTVFMNIRGQGSEFALKPTSQPPLSESEIWTLLATGRRQLKRGSGASMTGAEAATIVSSAIASELKKTLPSKVPLDVLSIEGGEEGLVGSQLEAGTYVTDKIYIGYTGRLGANPQKGENSHAVRFEYQISPRWSFESSYGDANAGGADLVWTRDY
ncbi:MAG: translocation/assembly module TamB domain-containing protein, partial [Myxococcaceae bacterium]